MVVKIIIKILQEEVEVPAVEETCTTKPVDECKEEEVIIGIGIIITVIVVIVVIVIIVVVGISVI